MSNQRLIRLHRYNGWNLLFLVVTGVILFLPDLRGLLAPIRTPLKYLHIFSGVISLIIMVAYLPQVRAHWERLRSRVGQKLNVLLLAALLIGWGLTGIALWFNRYVPQGWAEAALVWHDRLTWFAIPWATAHSLTRYYKLRVLPVTAPIRDRRLFLAGAAAVAGAIFWGRLGRTLGLPGFEPGGPAAAAVPDRHEPVPPGVNFLPPAVKDTPPGGGMSGRFRVYTVVNPMPTFDPTTWSLEVKGLVERPLRFTWQEFLNLPRTVQVSNFHCVTGWSVYSVTWEGVRLSELLDLAGALPEGRHVKFYSGDGEYTSAVPAEVARMEDVMLPYIMDGRLVPSLLGGPVRLIIPQMYAYKSVKWVNAIELIDQPYDGFWEVRGYPSDAWLHKA